MARFFLMRNNLHAHLLGQASLTLGQQGRLVKVYRGDVWAVVCSIHHLCFTSPTLYMCPKEANMFPLSHANALASYGNTRRASQIEIPDASCISEEVRKILSAFVCELDRNKSIPTSLPALTAPVFFMSAS